MAQIPEVKEGLLETIVIQSVWSHKYKVQNQEKLNYIVSSQDDGYSREGAVTGRRGKTFGVLTILFIDVDVQM
jgi:hypothetical protein